MVQNRSFKDYVANRFYSELYSAVSDFLEQNHSDLNVSSRLVCSIDSAELSNIEVKCVFVDNLPGMKIAFDILVEAEFEISETDRHTDRYDQKNQWFKISCTGDLACNLNDFEISGTEEYNSRAKQSNPVQTYKFEDDLPYGHGEKSVYILSGFMKLTREEAFAIRYHM